MPDRDKTDRSGEAERLFREALGHLERSAARALDRLPGLVVESRGDVDTHEFPEKSVDVVSNMALERFALLLATCQVTRCVSCWIGGRWRGGDYARRTADIARRLEVAIEKDNPLGDPDHMAAKRVHISV